MVDYYFRLVFLRQGVIAGAGLGIDHSNGVELQQVDIYEPVQVESEVADQRPVLTASDCAAVCDGTLNAGNAIGASAQRYRRGNGIRVRIVLHYYQKKCLIFENLCEFFDASERFVSLFHRLSLATRAVDLRTSHFTASTRIAAGEHVAALNIRTHNNYYDVN
jgi:hypothetical protein